MKRDAYITSELKEIAPALLPVNNREVYVPPVGYFDDLVLQIHKQVNQTELGQTVPQNYFTDLSSNILNRIQKEAAVDNLSSTWEEKDVSFPLLEQIGKVNPYTVPTNYFDQLAINPPFQISQTKVVKMVSFRRIASYAVAACFVGFLSVTAVKFLSKPDDVPPALAICTNLDDCLASVDDLAIQQYLEGNSSLDDLMDDTDATKPASDDELIDEIDNKDLDNLIKQVNEKPVNSTDL